VRPGDLAYLGGEAGTALDAYRKELESLGRPTPPDRPPTSLELEIWAGIALVSPRKAVRERPETVRAVLIAAGDVDLAGDVGLDGDVDLDTVATWLEGSLD
jgi:hypothetical protein